MNAIGIGIAIDEGSYSSTANQTTQRNTLCVVQLVKLLERPNDEWAAAANRKNKAKGIHFILL